jgi:hypothetical protein
MTALHYTGVGARATPPAELALMRALAVALAGAGWTLRSGGADGADDAFLTGAERAGGAVELYTPWPGFRDLTDATLTRPSAAAFDLAARHHPTWAVCGPAARALHARNSHEVLGARLSAPSRFLICWTSDGSLDGACRTSGGTGQALRIAVANRVPVFNLRCPEHRGRVEAFLDFRRQPACDGEELRP